MGEVRVSTGYRPRPHQQQIHKSLGRFSVLVCHRRFGKTVLCINELIDRALRCELPNPRYAYIAPLFNQAKDIAWTYLKQYTRDIPGVETHETELRVTLPNGAHIRLYGADNPDRLRGIYLDGVVLDEYAQMSPRIWGEVIRPLLSDRQGWAVFIGTPMGHNQFYDMFQGASIGWPMEQADGSVRRETDADWWAGMFRVSDTAIINEKELASALRTMGQDRYDQEYECSWEAAIHGAYYAREMAAAEREKRVRHIPWEPSVRVDTWWDLGISDSTAIWFTQAVGSELRFIDYYEADGQGLPHYAKMLDARPYVYGTHHIPHDGKHREWGTGKKRTDMMSELGLNTELVPDIGIPDGINAVRMLLPKCWFDAERCAEGIEALKQYRREWDDEKRTFKDKPLHDWTSHAADAMRYCAVGYREQRRDDPYKPRGRYGASGGTVSAWAR